MRTVGVTKSSTQRDKQFEIVLGRLLLGGFLLSAAIVLVGGVLYLIKYGHRTPQYGMFYGEPTDLRYASDVLRDALGGHSRGLIQLGLLLLIATPVARVALSVIEFARERDWLYVTTTLMVLVTLIYSLASS
jgi:uncharacterized membrane protein